MAYLILKVETTPAAGIHEAADAASRLAHVMGVWVEFDFNGVTCMAAPDGSADTLVDGYWRELNRASTVRAASSLPPTPLLHPAERELVDAVMARDRALVAIGGLAADYDGEMVDPTYRRLARALKAMRDRSVPPA